MFDRLKRDICLKYVFNDKKINDKIPKIYVKSRWIPPHAILSIENRIRQLQENIKQDRDEKILRSEAYNITRHQHNLLKSLRNNDDLMILNYDKILALL